MAKRYLRPRCEAENLDVWRFQISDSSGNRQYPTFPRKGPSKLSKAQAREAARKMMDELRSNGVAIEGHPSETLATYGRRVLTGRVHPKTNLPLSPQTEA